MNDNNTFTNICPVIKFTAKRKPKLNVLVKYANNSYGIIKGNNANGVPAGKNKPNVANPCIKKLCINIPPNIIDAILNVNTNSVDAVIEYGTKPK